MQTGAWQSRAECEMRREQMCSRAEGGGLGRDQLLQEERVLSQALKEAIDKCKLSSWPEGGG